MFNFRPRWAESLDLFKKVISLLPLDRVYLIGSAPSRVEEELNLMLRGSLLTVPAFWIGREGNASRNLLLVVKMLRRLFQIRLQEPLSSAFVPGTSRPQTSISGGRIVSFLSKSKSKNLTLHIGVNNVPLGGLTVPTNSKGVMSSSPSTASSRSSFTKGTVSPKGLTSEVLTKVEG